MKYLTIETTREGYGPNQLDDLCMTVADLISLLENFDEDLPVIFSNDRGYTYGNIYEENVTVENFNEEGERVDDDDEDF